MITWNEAYGTREYRIEVEVAGSRWLPWKGRMSRWWYEIMDRAIGEQDWTTRAYEKGGSGGAFTLKRCIRRASEAAWDFYAASQWHQEAHFNCRCALNLEGQVFRDVGSEEANLAEMAERARVLGQGQEWIEERDGMIHLFTVGVPVELRGAVAEIEQAGVEGECAGAALADVIREQRMGTLRGSITPEFREMLSRDHEQALHDGLEDYYEGRVVPGERRVPEGDVTCHAGGEEPHTHDFRELHTHPSYVSWDDEAASDPIGDMIMLAERYRSESFAAQERDFFGESKAHELFMQYEGASFRFRELVADLLGLSRVPDVVTLYEDGATGWTFADGTVGKADREQVELAIAERIKA